MNIKTKHNLHYLINNEETQPTLPQLTSNETQPTD